MEIEWSNGVVEVIKIVGLFLCNAITFKTNQKRKDYWKVWKVSFVDNRVWYNFIFCKAIVL